MQYSTLAFAVLPALALAAPQFPVPFNPAEDVAAAALHWHDDTMTVSQFLDFGATAGAKNDPQLKAKALVAYNAEVDELNHKGVLDAYFGTLNSSSAPANLVSASQVLVQDGTFQLVVDGLFNISQDGNLHIITKINKDRCRFVLPAIDAYINAGAAAAGQSIPVSVKPAACADIAAHDATLGHSIKPHPTKRAEINYDDEE